MKAYKLVSYEDRLFREMSGNFLTDFIPLYIIQADVSEYFELVYDFIDEHTLEKFEDFENGEILEMIEDCVSTAIKYRVMDEERV